MRESDGGRVTSMLLEAANSTESRNLSPRQIVPNLADRNQYIASESTFYRVLHEEGQLAHRQRTRPRRRHRPKEHVARGPNEVWSWDITYLRSPVPGVFFYLYLIVDVWSRKIVGWSLRYEESAEYARDLVQQAIESEGADPKKLVLHADNGGPMKGSTLLATLQRLGVVISFNRPGVSDDNAFSEAWFRTMKYHPAYPRKPFQSFVEALQWVEGFPERSSPGSGTPALSPPPRGLHPGEAPHTAHHVAGPDARATGRQSAPST
jgi:transposase InsO family protein